MLKAERIGYGYNRPDKDFKAHNCDLVLVDTKATRREHRQELMMRVQPRDTIVIFSWKEFAPGRLKEIMIADLKEIGTTVEVLEPPAKPKTEPSGRMTSEAIAHAKPMWHKPTIYSVEYIQDSLRRAGLGSYTRNQLNYALKVRNKQR